MSQIQEILTHLRNKGSITQREASTRYGCDRLAPRIFELRRMGFDILTDRETDGVKTWGRYVLCEHAMAAA